MEKRFYVDSTGATFMTVLLAPGFLMIALALIGRSSFAEVLTSLFSTFGVLYLLWFFYTKGIYVVIDQKNRLHTVAWFIRRLDIPLENVYAIKTREKLLGLMADLYLVHKKEDDSKSEDNFIIKESLKKEDLKKLFETMLFVNSKIEISHELKNYVGGLDNPK